jgi:diacylglycerol kinase family enzyme
VIYNPAAGRGKAETLFQTSRTDPDVELRPTERPGHAVELARQAAEQGFAKVMAAGGDGTVHEVANGILQSGNRDVTFAVWPVGSANDYAYTLGMTVWWARFQEQVARWVREANVKPTVRHRLWGRARSHPPRLLPVLTTSQYPEGQFDPPPTEPLLVDVGRITGGGRERFFVCNFGVGFNGMVNAEARKTRWLRGLPLYGWAFLKSIVRHFATPRMAIRFDGRETEGPTLALSVLLGQREGNFPLRPDASLTDGLFDYMHAKKLRRWHLLRYLPAMATGRLPENHPRISLGRAARIAVRSVAPLCAHADGEFFCVPADGISELVVEVIPARLRVEVYPPGMYGKSV